MLSWKVIVRLTLNEKIIIILLISNVIINNIIMLVFHPYFFPISLWNFRNNIKTVKNFHKDLLKHYKYLIFLPLYQKQRRIYDPVKQNETLCENGWRPKTINCFCTKALSEMIRYFNFDPRFALLCCRTRDLLWIINFSEL